MRDVALGDLITPARLVRPEGEDFPILSMTMHGGLVDQSDKFKKRIASVDVSAYKVVRRGQLVVGFPIDEGVLDFQLRYPAGIVSPAYGVWDVKEGAVDPNYLRRYLRSGRAIRYYKAKLRGSTARRRSLPAEVFLALPVFLPPLEEQRRIAAILDQADGVRAKRRHLLAQMNSLSQSLFMGMFGDPDNAAETVPFGEIASLTGGRNLVAEDSDAETPYRVLKISAVTSGQFRPSESKPLPLHYQPPVAHVVRAGDLLMSRANTSELVGAVAYVSQVADNLVLPDKIWRFEWRDTASDPTFYRVLFQSPSIRRRISRMSTGTGGSMKNVSKAKLADLRLPAVSFAEQRRFAAHIDRIEFQRANAERALALEDELFASLQSRAFRGKL